MTRRHTIKRRRVFVDLETGGRLSWKHPIIQIGAVAFDVDWQELERFEVKLKFDEADADPEALKKVGYSKHLWEMHGVEETTAFDRFAYFLREHATNEWTPKNSNKVQHRAQLFAHNATFESDFLDKWKWHLKKRHEERDFYLPADPRIICTMQAAMMASDQQPPPPPNYQLGTLCDFLGISFSTNRAHEAVYDAVKSAQLYHALTEGNDTQMQLNDAA